MKLALLKGNRFNPWHLQGFLCLEDTEVTAFRADSEIQRHFDERGGTAPGLRVQPIHFDTQKGPMPLRLWNRFAGRCLGREPRVLPFHDRLAGFHVLQSWELFTDWSAQAVIARERHGTPLSVMVWDNIPFNMERNPARRRMKAHVAANADAFIVHSERSRRTLGFEGVPSDLIVKFNPGVDLDLFRPGPRDRARFRLRDDDFVILFVGWFLPRKGIDFLILALRELLNDAALAGGRPRLLMVGSGPGRGRVEQLVKRLDLAEACVFAGSLPYDEMPGAFRAADCFVLPSIATPEWQEQFGMSLIEAMACGVPTVATLSGAVPEFAGVGARLCQPNDFVALYEALRELIQAPSLRRELGEAARGQALDRFGLDDFTANLARVYDDLQHNGPRGRL